ncbi:hypothetical protein CQW23_07381 [Capsicum baccatum]|uniref:Ubiquitin-like protease family profile domain-containing protein n=1 Tax=Capsicum baccatum TaxID=33114 RepID=A0A2G2X680_CAPBA|nr:hypothetical protein CQW23_07381 [Capsicum baccatum]
MAFKRDVIPSKRISYPYAPLEIKEAKRRRKDTSKASSSIKKAKLRCLYLCLAPMFSVQGPQESSMSRRRYCQQQLEVFQNEECLINTIKGFSILAGLPWHLIDEVYIPINCGDEFHCVLAIVVLKERRIQVYDLISRRRRFGPLSEIQKLAKILPSYLDMSGFLDQKVRTDWSTIEAYWDKMGNPFDVQYVEEISQQTIGSLNYGPFVVAYAEYLSDELQVPNNGIDAGLLPKRYADLLWKYGETKAQKPYTSDTKDP